MDEAEAPVATPPKRQETGVTLAAVVTVLAVVFLIATFVWFPSYMNQPSAAEAEEQKLTADYQFASKHNDEAAKCQIATEAKAAALRRHDDDRFEFWSIMTYSC